MPPESSEALRTGFETLVRRLFCYSKKGNQKMKNVLRLLLVLSFALASTAVFAQDIQTKGSVSGQVKDAQGGLIPGATVKVTGALGERTATTNDQGLYSVENLIPGTYKV